jgi:hypothetical protein
MGKDTIPLQLNEYGNTGFQVIVAGNFMKQQE